MRRTAESGRAVARTVSESKAALCRIAKLRIVRHLTAPMAARGVKREREPATSPPPLPSSSTPSSSSASSPATPTSPSRTGEPQCPCRPSLASAELHPQSLGKLYSSSALWPRKPRSGSAIFPLRSHPNSCTPPSRASALSSTSVPSIVPPARPVRPFLDAASSIDVAQRTLPSCSTTRLTLRASPATTFMDTSFLASLAWCTPSHKMTAHCLSSMCDRA